MANDSRRWHVAHARRWKRRVIWIGAGALGAALAGILALNLWPKVQTLQYRLAPVSAVRSEAFRREVGTLLGPPIVGGNTVSDYQNGAAIFPAMLAAIRGAQRSVNLETYIYWSGDISKEFIAALTER